MCASLHAFDAFDDKEAHEQPANVRLRVKECTLMIVSEDELEALLGVKQALEELKELTSRFRVCLECTTHRRTAGSLMNSWARACPADPEDSFASQGVRPGQVFASKAELTVLGLHSFPEGRLFARGGQLLALLLKPSAAPEAADSSEGGGGSPPDSCSSEQDEAALPPPATRGAGGSRGVGAALEVEVGGVALREGAGQQWCEDLKGDLWWTGRGGARPGAARRRPNSASLPAPKDLQGDDALMAAACASGVPVRVLRVVRVPLALGPGAAVGKKRSKAVVAAAAARGLRVRRWLYEGLYRVVERSDAPRPGSRAAGHRWRLQPLEGEVLGTGQAASQLLAGLSSLTPSGPDPLQLEAALQAWQQRQQQEQQGQGQQQGQVDQGQAPAAGLGQAGREGEGQAAGEEAELLTLPAHLLPEGAGAHLLQPTNSSGLGLLLVLDAVADPPPGEQQPGLAPPPGSAVPPPACPPAPGPWPLPVFGPEGGEGAARARAAAQQLAAEWRASGEYGWGEGTLQQAPATGAVLQVSGVLDHEEAAMLEHLGPWAACSPPRQQHKRRRGHSTGGRGSACDLQGGEADILPGQEASGGSGATWPLRPPPDVCGAAARLALGLGAGGEGPGRLGAGSQKHKAGGGAEGGGLGRAGQGGGPPGWVPVAVSSQLLSRQGGGKGPSSSDLGQGDPAIAAQAAARPEGGSPPCPWLAQGGCGGPAWHDCSGGRACHRYQAWLQQEGGGRAQAAGGPQCCRPKLQRCPALPLEVFAAAPQPPPSGPAARGPGPGPGVAQQWALRCAEELAAGTAVCCLMGQLVTAAQAAQLSRTAQPGLSSWHRLLPLDHITRCWQPFLDRGLLGWAAVLAGADEPDHHSAAFFRGLPPMPLWPFTASRLLSAKELAALPLERMECAAGPQNSGNAQLKKHEAEVTAYAMPDARTLFDSWRRATALPGKTPDFTDYKVAAEKVLRDAAMLPNEATRDSVTGDERASHGAPHLLVLDVSQAGNASRFVRHSNEANLTAQVRLLPGHAAI
ncbi:hypothetical protein QJQ45_009334 [Haematococcus lacustris]|nr:hypothetical protein QJQ45_009334 [Haematococcus lacustris]